MNSRCGISATPSARPEVEAGVELPYDCGGARADSEIKQSVLKLQRGCNGPGVASQWHSAVPLPIEL